MNLGLYKDLIKKYKSAESRRREIEDQASRERTQWEDVIDIFNSRFYVPFRLECKNRVSVILGQEPLLNLDFVFEDGAEQASIDRTKLVAALSMGEKKALYILNVIFEIEVRARSGSPTILVIDDIADSFDYKNKYAIIQYLQDISERGSFKQIILTHNFDFFRTINSRNLAPYKNCFMVSKNDKGVSIAPAAGIRNIFVKDWKGKFGIDGKKTIACIPFMRNLIEYTKGEDDPDYIKMTSLLHWKKDTKDLKQTDLFTIYNAVFGSSLTPPGPAEIITDLIFREAEDCLNAPDSINFENKIVLSIATRLKAEIFMVDAINSPSFVDAITGMQTFELLKKFKQLFPLESAKLATLDRVTLMTPENIHLNSFMYEPILDMSDHHLRTLYNDVKGLV